jgi:hypothetical protein
LGVLFPNTLEASYWGVLFPNTLESIPPPPPTPQVETNSKRYVQISRKLGSGTPNMPKQHTKGGSRFLVTRQYSSKLKPQKKWQLETSNCNVHKASEYETNHRPPFSG